MFLCLDELAFFLASVPPAAYVLVRALGTFGMRGMA